MACANVDMDIRGADEEPRGADGRGPPVTRQYEAAQLVPDDNPLHDLLKLQPAVLGSLQMVSGVLSVGVGIIFAVTQDMERSLLNLFRVSHLTGALFIVAGIISNLLFQYPRLLPVSLKVNCGCIAVAVVAAVLIGIDLADWSPDNVHFRMELLELCVLGLEVCLSAILCCWFSKENKRAKSP